MFNNIEPLINIVSTAIRNGSSVVLVTSDTVQDEGAYVYFNEEPLNRSVYELFERVECID